MGPWPLEVGQELGNWTSVDARVVAAVAEVRGYLLSSLQVLSLLCLRCEAVDRISDEIELIEQCPALRVGS